MLPTLRSLAIPFRIAACRCFASSARRQRAAAPAEPPAFEIIPTLRLLGFTDPALDELSTSPPPVLAAQWRKIHLLLRDQVPVSLLSKPHVFKFLSATPDERILSFLDLSKSFNLSFQNSVTLLLRNTSLASCRPESLRRKWTFLRNLSSDNKMVMKGLVACPRLLSMSVETLQKRHANLQRLGLHPKLLRKRPSSCHIDVPKEDQLKEELGVDCYMKALAADPVVLQSRFYWLKAQGFSSQEMVQLLSTCPTIFRLTDSLMDRKIGYLVAILGREPSELVKFPQYLTYSLENRIIPRFTALAEMKKNGDLKAELSLASVLSCTDENFALLCKKLA